MQTLLLSTDDWDLVADASGNIAVASEPYALAQDAASEIKLFEGEAYYDTGRGVPYWTQILGKSPPISLIKAKFVAAAMLTPTVVDARCYFARISDRVVSGQVQVTDESGKLAATSF
jgi:hypothetical protein